MRSTTSGAPSQRSMSATPSPLDRPCRTIFWIAPDGEIEISSVGWIKKEMEELNQRAAQALSEAATLLFRADEHIADFRAG